MSHKSPDKRPRRQLSRRTVMTAGVIYELIGVALILLWIPVGNLALPIVGGILIIGGLLTQASRR